MAYTRKSSSQEREAGGSEIQGQSLLCNKFKISPGHMRPHLWLAGRKRDGRGIKINHTKINWMQETSLSPDRKIWNIYTHACVHNQVCIWVCMFNRHVLRSDYNIQYQFLQNYFISWFSCWVRKESQIKKIISLNQSLRSNKEKITEIWVSLVYMRLYFV